MSKPCYRPFLLLVGTQQFSAIKLGHPQTAQYMCPRNVLRALVEGLKFRALKYIPNEKNKFSSEKRSILKKELKSNIQLEHGILKKELFS